MVDVPQISLGLNNAHHAASPRRRKESSGLSSRGVNARRTASRRARSSRRIRTFISISRVRRGSPHTPTAIPPIAMVGMPSFSSRSWNAITASISSFMTPVIQAGETRLQLDQRLVALISIQRFGFLEPRFEFGQQREKLTRALLQRYGAQ